MIIVGNKIYSESEASARIENLEEENEKLKLKVLSLYKRLDMMEMEFRQMEKKHEANIDTYRRELYKRDIEITKLKTIWNGE
jgi:predicted RNase H-like nuclease (RuvC/YqgF family)